MWPLLRKDGLGVQYIALTILWNAALGYTPFKRPKTIIQTISLVSDSVASVITGTDVACPVPGVQIVSVACVTLHVLEFVIRPPARYPDLFPVLNVLISTPVFGLVWLWSIKSGIEVGWAIVGLGGGNPAGVHSNQDSRPTSTSSTANLTITTSPKKAHSHLIPSGDSRSPLSPADSPLSPFALFNRRVGSPPVIPGPRRPGVREHTWSNASTNSSARTRGNLPIGPEWGRRMSLDRGERTEGGENASIQGLRLNLDPGGGGEDHTRQRNRGQSLDMSNVRRRVPNFPRNVEGLPPPSD